MSIKASLGSSIGSFIGLQHISPPEGLWCRTTDAIAHATWYHCCCCHWEVWSRASDPVLAILFKTATFSSGGGARDKNSSRPNGRLSSWINSRVLTCFGTRPWQNGKAYNFTRLQSNTKLRNCRRIWKSGRSNRRDNTLEDWLSAQWNRSDRIDILSRSRTILSSRSSDITSGEADTKLFMMWTTNGFSLCSNTIFGGGERKRSPNVQVRNCRTARNALRLINMRCPFQSQTQLSDHRLQNSRRRYCLFNVPLNTIYEPSIFTYSPGSSRRTGLDYSHVADSYHQKHRSCKDRWLSNTRQCFSRTTLLISMYITRV